MDALDRLTPPAAVGERLVIRHRLPDGSATDVIGWLVDLQQDRVLVQDHTGERSEIERDLIVASRHAPPARGGPDPLRTSAPELEQIALPGWVAEREPLGEWTLRAGAGFTGRANSCLAVGDPGVPVAEAAARIEAHAAARGIAPRAQVIAGSAPERGLRDLGWTEDYVATDVLVGRLNQVLAAPPHPGVEVAENLSPAWAQAYQVSRPNTADPATLRRILTGEPPTALAGVEHGGQLIAIGRGHVSADWLGLASLWTAPEERRRGWATRVITALGHWAARRGARNVYLQVATENEPAHRAYASLGFAFHHSYLYLAPRAAAEAAD